MKCGLHPLKVARQILLILTIKEKWIAPKQPAPGHYTFTAMPGTMLHIHLAAKSIISREETQGAARLSIFIDGNKKVDGVGTLINEDFLVH